MGYTSILTADTNQQNNNQPYGLAGANLMLHWLVLRGGWQFTAFV